MTGVAAPRRPGRRWPVALLLLALLAAGVLAAAWSAVDALGVLPVHIEIDGEPAYSGLDLAALAPAEKLLLSLLLAFVLLAALILVPLALLVVLLTALGGVLLAAVTGVGLPLLALAAVLALLLSPLALLALLAWALWRALRPSPTMPR